jgi:hypothetical protein
MLEILVRVEDTLEALVEAETLAKPVPLEALPKLVPLERLVPLEALLKLVPLETTMLKILVRMEELLEELVLEPLEELVLEPVPTASRPVFARMFPLEPIPADHWKQFCIPPPPYCSGIRR